VAAAKEVMATLPTHCSEERHFLHELLLLRPVASPTSSSPSSPPTATASARSPTSSDSGAATGSPTRSAMKKEKKRKKREAEFTTDDLRKACELLPHRYLYVIRTRYVHALWSLPCTYT
jgi:hypothetical protein